jgi:hypothetical protein
MFSKQNKKSAERETETLKMSAAPRNASNLKNPWPVAMNNFFVLLEDAEVGSEGNSTKTLGMNVIMAKVDHPCLQRTKMCHEQGVLLEHCN